jgi:carboxymethylenebutenolidase
MCDQDHYEEDLKLFEERGLVTRRQFGILLGAGVAMMLPQVANAVTVTDAEVTVTTPDGTSDCYFVHPSTGTAPAVLVWPDIFGLRPAFRTMGKRLAESGYSVLVVNPFYRQKKAPTAENGAATSIPTLVPMMQALTGNMNLVMSDAKAYIAWLDQQPSVAKNKKIGTQGYCMGGPLVMRTAASSARIGAGGSFHGGGLVSDRPNSPHLLAPKIHARMYFGVAKNDDQRQPDAKDKLKAALEAAHVANKIEVYPADHGWCMRDMPPAATGPIYSKPDAERAWGELLALYKQAIA